MTWRRDVDAYRPSAFTSALLAVTLISGIVIGAQRGGAVRPECGATGAVVAVQRTHTAAACVVTGVIMDARIDLAVRP